MTRSAQHPHDDRSGRPAAMSREAAERILRRHGLDAAGLAPEELKRRWQDLARRHHPDLGGDIQAMQEINAAYARLKPSAAAAAAFAGVRDTTSPRVRGFPAWVWAGHGGAGTGAGGVFPRGDSTAPEHP